MTTRRRLVMMIALSLIATLIGGAIPAAGQDDPADYKSPLLDMLALVPDNALVHDSGGWATVRFADFQAYFIAEGIDELRQTLPVETLFEMIPVAGLMRIVAAPGGLQYMFPVMGEMDQLVGFEWFEDAVYSLEFGQVPQEGLILGGDFDADAVAAALSTRESEPFESTDVNGVTVWHRFEDGSVNIAARDPGDPFNGELGAAARIAVLPGYLANARFWDGTEAIIAAAQDETDSLADDPNYRALTEAITAPDGILIQALFFNLVDVGFPVGDPMVTMQNQDSAPDPTDNYGPLLPYALAVLADRQEGTDQVHLIALVYPDAALAADAADEVAERVRTFAIPGRDMVAVEDYGATVSARVYESESTGSAVAVIEARYPMPDERVDESGRFITSGLMYRNWIDMMIRREFFLLAVTAEE